MPTKPFVERETWIIDFGELVAEAIPLVLLVIVVALAGAIPFVGVLLVEAIGLPQVLEVVFLGLAWLVNGVGGLLILMYVISRSIRRVEK
jgi:hypothetical protein